MSGGRRSSPANEFIFETRTRRRNRDENPLSEAQLVVATGLLGIVLMFPPLLALIQAEGLAAALGNRDEAPVLPEWANRASRAQRNLVENLAPFVVLVVGTRLADVPVEAIHLGVSLFFWGRVLHAAVYIAGIPLLRTAAFALSLVGLLQIAAAGFFS